VVPLVPWVPLVHMVEQHMALVRMVEQHMALVVGHMVVQPMASGVEHMVERHMALA